MATETYVPGFGADAGEALLSGTMSNPFSVLGPHKNGRRWSVTALLPGADSVEVLDGRTGKREATLERLDGRGLFSGYVRAGVATGVLRRKEATDASC